MAHQFETGFVVRKPAWHGLAKVLDNYPGRDEAIKIAGHDWQVEECPIYAGKPEQFDAAAVLFSKDDLLTSSKALRRSDTKAILSVVNSTYGVVQNSVLWDIVDALMGQPNVKYETAGVLAGGSMVWVLAPLDEPHTVKGDNSIVKPYILAGTRHDALGKTFAQLTGVRVVCANTWLMAENERTSRYEFKHSAKVMDRIDDAKRAITSVRDEFQVFKELTDELVQHRVTEDGVKEFLSMFIPPPPADIETPRIMKNIEETRNSIKDLLEGVTVPDDHRRTAYGLFLAGTEYLDHLRGFRTTETHFRRTMLDNGKLKARVASLALKCAV